MTPPNSRIYRHLRHPPIHTKLLHHWSYNSFEVLKYFGYKSGIQPVDIGALCYACDYILYFIVEIRTLLGI
jgi:hypothetical protein